MMSTRVRRYPRGVGSSRPIRVCDCGRFGKIEGNDNVQQGMSDKLEVMASEISLLKEASFVNLVSLKISHIYPREGPGWGL